MAAKRSDMNGSGAVAKKPRARKPAAAVLPPDTEAVAVEPVAVAQAPPAVEPAPIVAAVTEPQAVLPPPTSEPQARGGVKAKMIVGIPEVVTLHLEPATFPERAQWLKSEQGLVAGIAIEGPSESVISYNPVVIPRVNGGKRLVVYVALSADRPGPEAGVEVRALHANGSVLVFGMKGLASCVDRPEIGFPIVLDQLGRTLTVAVVVRPRGAYRVIIHSVWAEIEA